MSSRGNVFIFLNEGNEGRPGISSTDKTIFHIQIIGRLQGEQTTSMTKTLQAIVLRLGRQQHQQLWEWKIP